MSLFAEEVVERVRRARTRLREALDTGDAHGVDLAREEVADALRLACEHGISTGDTEDG